MNTQDSDGEADSLFGSPPPSPAPEITRGGSPALALPGSSCAPCATFSELPKNVGTIALPGSHAHSELAVSLPESFPSLEPVRPVQPTQPVHRAQSTQPAQPGLRQYRFAEWIGPRATSLPVRNSTRPKHRGKKKAKSTTPEVTSNDGIPPHFLKNQRDSHGLGGVVGGLNTANSSFHDSHGTTKDNPIVVDEETSSAIASPWDASQPQVPSNRSLPNSQAIADTLISQGNIFPVLRSLMPYIGLNTNVGCGTGRTLQQYRFHDQLKSNPNITAPPLKRRKLSSVPAGAKDWDVPYPFPANEGPPNYLQSWQKKRGKKLMMQLVSLVREAVQKASAKSQRQGPESNAARSVEEAASVDSRQPDMPAVTEEVPDNVVSVAAGSLPISAPSDLEQQAMFSDIFASSGVMDPTLHFDSNFDSFLSAVNDALRDPNVQLTGNDLAAMSSYPFSPSDSASPTLTDSTRFPTPTDSAGPLATERKENDALQMQDFNFDDLPIDPNLLEFPWPDLSTSGARHLEAGSSIPATLENVPRTDSGQQIASDTTSLNETTENISVDPANVPAIDLPSSFVPPVDDWHMHAPSASTNEPIASDIPDAAPSVSVATQSRNTHQQGELDFKLPMVGENIIRGQGAESGPSSMKEDRRDVLRRARVRREQLAAEVARAKIELWETTIEQGVLTHLSKDKELHTKT